MLPIRHSGNDPEKAAYPQDKARLSKAAAWLWHSRSIGDAVTPTRMPVVTADTPVRRVVCRHIEASVGKRTQQEPLVVSEPPLRAATPSARPKASRFKVEADSKTSHANDSVPSMEHDSLYDELELLSIQSQLKHYLQHAHQRSESQDRAAPDVCNKGNTIVADQLSHTPHKSVSYIRRLLQKIIFPSHRVAHKPAWWSESESGEVQHHFRHYVHHHHHHYHYATSPKERTNSSRSRRHSIGGLIRSDSSISERRTFMIPKVSDETSEDEDTSHIGQVPAYRRARRLSENSSAQCRRMAVHEGGWSKSFSTASEPQNSARSLRSDRSTNKSYRMSTPLTDIRTKDSGQFTSHADDRRRRRHSSESFQRDKEANIGWATIERRAGVARDDDVHNRIYAMRHDSLLGIDRDEPGPRLRKCSADLSRNGDETQFHGVARSGNVQLHRSLPLVTVMQSPAGLNTARHGHSSRLQRSDCRVESINHSRVYRLSHS
ncbi:hypothetical protein KP509_19G037400 [Ceratopteris richardii]|nr:hypothetical protein KP509_19G037400 [Ceratopteris richardii]